MSIVWKYPFPQRECRLSCLIPVDSPIVHIGLDPSTDAIALWVLIHGSDRETTEQRRFVIRGTGQESHPGEEYRGTVRDGCFMWHVFEEKL